MRLLNSTVAAWLSEPAPTEPLEARVMRAIDVLFNGLRLRGRDDTFRVLRVHVGSDA